MAYPHPIRLHGPWGCQPLARSGDGPVPPPSRVFPPCTWETACGSDFFGTVRFTRTFHPPSALDPHERVWLVVEGADARGEVSLNGQRLGSVEGYALAAEWEVNDLLQGQNELTIDVECRDDESEVLRLGREHRPGGLTGEVRLEVRSTAFVAGLALWAVATSSGAALTVSGTVGGQAGTHTLVVNGLGRELLYAEVPVDDRFDLNASVPDLPGWPTPGQAVGTGDSPLAALEIKLISGATAAWQARLRTAAAPLARVTEGRGLSIAGRPTAWPTIIVEPPDDVNQFPASVRQPIQAAGLVGLRGVAHASVYKWFDQSATAIVQMLPSEWLERVGPRLAHHPSIIAWELVGGTAAGERETAFGRPVIRSFEVPREDAY